MKILVLVLCAVSLQAADTVSQLYERQLKSTEGEFVSLVEAMPADKFDFAPTQGAFNGVRTFAAQAKHAAAVVDLLSAAISGAKVVGDENGPANATSKEDVVKFVKQSFAHAHAAIATLTEQNLMGQVANPFDAKKTTARISAANEIIWHTFDHYGQMVEYARMNNVVPPASR